MLYALLSVPCGIPSYPRRPDFVAFYVFAGNLYDHAARDLFELLANDNPKLHDRVAVNFGQAFDAANAGTFDQSFGIMTALSWSKVIPPKVFSWA